MTKPEVAELFKTLARRLDSRAKWLRDPTYGTSDKNAAVADALYGVAEECRALAVDLEID